MIRLLLRLVGIKDYEVCASCETLKAQLALVNAEKKELTETLLRIVSPKVTESIPVEIQPIVSTSGIFSRRRAALEAKDRAEAAARQSKNLGRPDIAAVSIETLEKEVGIEEETQANA